jgi:Asp-tRNA(Asn)/Glu-tRNA(Gln) amidotransferase A subunit family amidase
MTEPCDLSAVEARRLIGQRQLSPLELLESCLDRIAAVDHAVNAVVACNEEEAREAARAAEARVMSGEPLPALHGLPIGIKDATATAGMRTTWGSPIYRDHVPEKDEAVIAALRAAGGIVLCKTNTPEWSAGGNTRNPVYGATGNPFDVTKSAAGSSGGSAVALATGMVPLATGTDVGGSLRSPAAYSGVAGFRPSFGLVPSDVRALGWSGMSVLGPMARNIGDLSLLLSAMVSDAACDPLATTIRDKAVRNGSDFYPPRAVSLKSLRVAFTPDFGFAPTEKRIRDVFFEKTAPLRAVFAAAADATPDCDGADKAFAVLRAADFLANHLERMRAHPDMIGPHVRADLEAGLRYTAADVAAAEVARTRLYRRWQEFFGAHDIVITPMVTLSPRAWAESYPKEIDGAPTQSYFHWLALSYAVTLAGHPAATVPIGLDHDGMPFGLQIVGPRGGDAFVLGVAAALEALFAQDPATARPVPDIARLRAAPPISQAADFFAV